MLGLIGTTKLRFRYSRYCVPDLIQLISSSRQKREQSSSSHYGLQIAHRGNLLTSNSLDHGARIDLFIDDDLLDGLLGQLDTHSFPSEILPDATRRRALANEL